MATAVRDRNADKAEYVIRPELQEELLKHPGKWVAMDRARILAIADDPSAALAAARKAGHEHPTLYRVPDKGTAYFF